MKLFAKNIEQKEEKKTKIKSDTFYDLCSENFFFDK